MRNFLVSFFGLALAGMLALWGYDYYKHRGDKTPFEQKAGAARDTTRAAEILVHNTDTLWLPARTRYVTVRERNSTNPAGKAVGEACDSLLAVDSKRLAARDTLVGALKRELNVWQNKPGPPRLQAYGEALYDVAHMVPIGRIGATLRVVGPIHLSAAGEYAAPKAGTATPAFRTTVGLRYDF